MSVSRPTKGKIIPRPPPPVVSSPVASSSRGNTKSSVTKTTKREPIPQLREAALRKEARQVIQAAKNKALDKGKGKAAPRTPPAPISIHSTTSEAEDDEDDFEEVEIPAGAGPSTAPGTPTTPGTNLTRNTTPGTVTTEPSIDDEYGAYHEDAQDISEEEDDTDIIRVEIGGETPEEKAKRIALAQRKKPMTSKDRAVRLEAHKMHVLALLAAVRIRNKWCCNMLLKARLLSLLPHPLQSAFNIPPSRFPDRAQRSRLFFDALQSLVTWWSQSFFDISDVTLGLRTRPWDEVQEVIDSLPRLTKADLFGSGFGSKEQDWDDTLEKMAIGAGAEKLRSPNSLMKKVLQQEGSRDVSAQLFVALARACGLGARLVASLQAVPWRAEKGTPKKKTGKSRLLAHRQGNGTGSDEENEEDDFEEVPIPKVEEDKEGGPGGVVDKIKGKKSNVRAAGRRRHIDPADVYRLRPSKPAPQKVGTPSKPKPRVKEDLSHQPPVFWAEIFSRSDQRWVPVDPVSGVIRKKTHYEPTSDSGPIRMLYVVAFEEDGYARDVTLRYTKNFGAKTIKLRVPQRKDEPDWWSDIMGFLQRPYRLNRDDLEDAELETSQVSEGMPMHMSGFKDHPIYVLERHLKREEIITPKREVGRFRGEAVYRRANVASCKTAENWMRQGRRVKDKEEPLKWVKQRAVTLQKRRAQELAIQDGGEAIQQGLYAEWQTEVYRPPPVKDGVIPQNSFGNIDLYAPTMLPQGAVHLPYKGIAKVAKALGISYAEACTGFEFKKQRAIPVITGIVVAAENESLTLEAYWESAAAAEVKERTRKEEKALKRWVKLVNGLRIRARLQAQYGAGEELQEQQRNPLADPGSAGEVVLATSKAGKKTAVSVLANTNKEYVDAWQNKFKDDSPDREDGIKKHDFAEDIKPDVDQVENRNGGHVEVGEGSGADQAMNDESTEVEDVTEEPGEEGMAEVPVPDTVELPTPPQRTRRITLRAPTASATPLRQTPVRSSKRKAASPESDNPSSDSEIQSFPPKKPPRRRLQVAVKAPRFTTTTRSLRSRAPKSEEKVREEEERRERVKRALESDQDQEDDD